MGGVTPELLVLGSLRKQAEEAIRSKPESSTHAFVSSCLQVPIRLEFPVRGFLHWTVVPDM